MNKLTWWMRIVGAFYLLQFVVMAFIRAPIRTMTPEGTLDSAAAGDAVAKFLVDTWIIFGVEVGVIGGALIVASRYPAKAPALVWTVIAIEFFKGPVCDIYMLTRGYEVTAFVIWIVIHSVIIVTGWLALRSSQRVAPVS